MGQPLSDDDLQAAIDAYVQTGGNKSAAAKLLELPRITYLDRLKAAEIRFGVVMGKVADGRISEIEHREFGLPEEGRVRRFVLTSVQNNTFLHPGWINLEAYAKWLDALPGSAGCQFLAGTFSYDLNAYGAKNVKRGSAKAAKGDPWYAPEIVQYLADERIELAPGLVWCGEMNILPTAKHPLTGLETYNGRKSNIVPHAKIAMESIPSMPGEGTKFNWSTGTITQRNYIQKKAGITAEQTHTYGGLLVEVNAKGNWWVRQLHIDGNGHVYDVGPDGYSGVRVADGTVEAHQSPVGLVNSITWGDIHTAEMEPWVRELGWGHAGMLDDLHPRYQIMHDIFSMRSRGHHDMKDFHVMYAKRAAGQDSVQGEINFTRDFLRGAGRPWCETVIVPSNHDRHLDRWLKEEDPRKDLGNAKYHMELQAALLDAIDNGVAGFNILEYALRAGPGLPGGIRFLFEDESFVVCRDVDGGIECGLHGDRGPNGSRGSTRGLAKLGRAVNKGHDHTAAIRENVYSVGACSMNFAYMHGPTGHSISHVVTFENGRRQIVTMWDGRWRA